MTQQDLRSRYYKLTNKKPLFKDGNGIVKFSDKYTIALEKMLCKNYSDAINILEELKK